MVRTRYMIVDHHTSKDQVGIDEKGGFVNALCIHGCLGTYHWARLSEDHVLVVSDYSLTHHQTLKQHGSVSVLPVVSSGKSLSKHLQAKPQHWESLKKRLPLDESSTMGDAVELFEDHFGPVFSASK